MLIVEPSRCYDPNRWKDRALGAASSADKDLHGACCALNSGGLATAAVGNADARRADLASSGLSA
jgi:hypothetical protein